ncbi:MAG TPA: hypothetical protein P5531_03870 [Bacteroidales bacterium]|nr:hypothetical protein [Bacteroidales bacterium]
MKYTSTSTDTFPAFVKQATGLTIIKEHRFHPTRKWRFDYAIPQINLAIEVEGGIYKRGRHVRPKGFIKDMEKYNTATTMGWRVIRIQPSELMTTNTIIMINSFK